MDPIHKVVKQHYEIGPLQAVPNVIELLICGNKCLPISCLAEMSRIPAKNCTQCDMKTWLVTLFWL